MGWVLPQTRPPRAGDNPHGYPTFSGRPPPPPSFSCLPSLSSCGSYQQWHILPCILGDLSTNLVSPKRISAHSPLPTLSSAWYTGGLGQTLIDSFPNSCPFLNRAHLLGAPKGREDRPTSSFQYFLFNFLLLEIRAPRLTHLCFWLDFYQFYMVSLVISCYQKH